MGTGLKDLRVWIEARKLAIAVYHVNANGPLARDFGLRDQIRRAAVSVPSNIAEGDERDTDKDSVRCFYIAKGSLAELRTQLDIAHETGFVSAEDFTSLDADCVAIGRMLGALIKARTKKPTT